MSSLLLHKTIKLVNSDCLGVLPSIPDSSIHMVLTDLPYGITNCHWDSLIDLELLWREWKRVLKPNGLVVLFGTQPFTSKLVLSNPEWFKFTYVWEKNCPSNIACANIQPLRYSEDIIVFYKQQPTFNKQMIERSESGKKLIKQYQKNNTTFKLSTSDVSSSTPTEVDPMKYDANLKNPSNILKFGVERGRRRYHQTQKPVDLLEYLIKTHTNEGDLVLDNCMGSGSTVIAAMKTKRNCIGIEKDPKIFGTAAGRILNEAFNSI